MMTKKEFLTSLTTVVILLLATWLFVFPPSFLQSGNNDTPPSLSITTSKFQGSISGADVCKIPGLLDLSSKVAGYKPPPGAPESEKYELKAGSHFYHSDTDITIQQIIDSIVPTDKNKILIAYYPSGIVNAKKQFLVHPKIEGQLFVNDPADPATSKIPANEGFLILSCQDTKIWKIKDETMPAQAATANLATIKEGWILVTRVKGEDLATTVKKYPNKIKSIWTQKDVGFNFKKPKDTTEMNAAGGYNMVWLKTFTLPDQPAEAKVLDPPKNLKLLPDSTTEKLKFSWERPDNIPVNEIKNYSYQVEYGKGETVGQQVVQKSNVAIDPNSDGGMTYEISGLTYYWAEKDNSYWITVALVDKTGTVGKKAELKTNTSSLTITQANEVKVFLMPKTADQAVKGGDTIILATLALNSESKASVKEIIFTQKGNVNPQYFENIELFAAKKMNDNGQLDSPVLVTPKLSLLPKSITMQFDTGKLQMDNSYLYLQLKTKVPVEDDFFNTTYNIGLEKLSDIQLFENNLILVPSKNEYALPAYGTTYMIYKPPPPSP